MMHGPRIGGYRISQDQSGRYARHFATGQCAGRVSFVRHLVPADLG
jgi:hypothetical protein